MNINNNPNHQACPILGQPLVIANIANKLEPELNFQNLAAHSKEELCAYGRILSAFMLSCKTIGDKKFLKQTMYQVKECYKEKCLSDWNEKYPIFANRWKPGSNRDLQTLFSMKQLRNANNIDDKFPLIRAPQLILKVIGEAYPGEMYWFKRIKCVEKELMQTTNALLHSCKALYNCKTLQNFHQELKETRLCKGWNPIGIKLGEKIYNYPGGPGWLNDIFLTGSTSPYIGGTHPTYVGNRSWNTVLEEDVKKIVRLFPESLLCIKLNTRLVDQLSPFAMACMNEHIPLSMVEFLLENKADPNQCARWCVGEHAWHWSDTSYYIHEEDPIAQQIAQQTRFQEIVKMVKKHNFSFRTEVIVNYDCGFNHNLFIRGNEMGSWNKGWPLINLSANSWIFVFSRQDIFNFEYKILIDDRIWEKDVSEMEKNHKGESGQQLSIVPHF